MGRPQSDSNWGHELWTGTTGSKLRTINLIPANKSDADLDENQYHAQILGQKAPGWIFVEGHNCENMGKGELCRICRYLIFKTGATLCIRRGHATRTGRNLIC